MASSPVAAGASRSRLGSLPSSSLGRLWAALDAMLARWSGASNRRGRLERLDDRILRDIGLEPRDGRHEEGWIRERYLLGSARER
ncbi:MAG TPA: hypothetical protein VMG60_21165 [Burkholderiaceae bacterium]|nr:hypothetical protein [Burkholderiaceae bacterium]